MFEGIREVLQGHGALDRQHVQVQECVHYHFRLRVRPDHAWPVEGVGDGDSVVPRSHDDHCKFPEPFPPLTHANISLGWNHLERHDGCDSWGCLAVLQRPVGCCGAGAGWLGSLGFFDDLHL